MSSPSRPNSRCSSTLRQPDSTLPPGDQAEEVVGVHGLREVIALKIVAGSEATPTGGLGRYSTQGGHISLPPGETRDQHLPRGTPGDGRRCSLASACVRRSRHRPAGGRLDVTMADGGPCNRPCCLRVGRVFARQAIPVGDWEPTLQRRLARPPDHDCSTDRGHCRHRRSNIVAMPGITGPAHSEVEPSLDQR